MALDNGLYIVPTPIGNLEDITLRAINILREVDLIACEDTRRTGKLLKHLAIPHKELMSYYDSIEIHKKDKIVNLIQSGKSVALVSDSGTPLISDPGFKLIRECIEKQLPIYPLPGPTAFVPALVASGFPVHHFCFLGFPPPKKGRRIFIDKVIKCPYTVIIYEAANKILKLLKEIQSQLEFDIEICIAREISKVYEEFIRGRISDCISSIEKKQLKGELVLVINEKM